MKRFINLNNAAFTFLPVLIGFSADKIFGGTPVLGAVLVTALNVAQWAAALGLY